MTQTLKDKILCRQPGLLFYSFAPPKITTEAEQLQHIAQTQMDRIRQVAIDGLILYDIQDESHRTNEKRVYPYIPTYAPEDYSRHYLGELDVPKIIYKSIAHHTPEQFAQWLQRNSDIDYTVFVGASAQNQVTATHCTLQNAYDMKSRLHPNLILGGVTIPERHAKKGDEHLRILDKKQKGCQFFVSQCVYNLYDTKNLLSDYYYDSLDNGYALAPLIFTLSPCGSLKTLEFMKWLGIEVTKWLYNDLKHAKDILESSVNTLLQIAGEIIEFAHSKQIPIGFNIESVSNKKAEIDASMELLAQVAQLIPGGAQSMEKLNMEHRRVLLPSDDYSA